MIFLAVKLSRLDVSRTQLKQVFNFYSNHLRTTSQEAVSETCIKSGDKKLTAEKVNLLADHRGNAVSNFFNSIFIEKQVVLLFSDINVQ